MRLGSMQKGRVHGRSVGLPKRTVNLIKELTGKNMVLLHRLNNRNVPEHGFGNPFILSQPSKPEF